MKNKKECVNHRWMEATHLEDSHIIDRLPHPICKICVDYLKENYIEIYKALNVRPIN